MADAMLRNLPTNTNFQNFTKIQAYLASTKNRASIDMLWNGNQQKDELLMSLMTAKETQIQS